MFVCDILDKRGNKIKNFVLKITELHVAISRTKNKDIKTMKLALRLYYLEFLTFFLFVFTWYLKNDVLYVYKL
jgi:hypothetical protein